MKLTKALRDSLIETLTNKVYPSSEMEPLKKELLDHFLSLPIVQERRRLVKKYPEYISAGSTLRVHNRSPYKIGFYIPLPYAVGLPLKNYYSTHEVVRSTDVRDDQAKYYYIDETFDDIIARYNAREDATEEFRKKVRDILYSCNTSKQLLEIFPEIAEYLPSEDATVKRAQAIVPTESINAVRDKLIALAQNAENEPQDVADGK